jgi:hypothetical protein
MAENEQSEVIAGILKTAKSYLQFLRESQSLDKEYVERNLKEAEKHIDDAAARLDRIPLSRWDNQKKTRFEKINAYISFVPTVIAALLLVYAFVWSKDQRVENSALKNAVMHKDSVIKYSDHWILKIDQIVDSNLIRNVTGITTVKNEGAPTFYRQYKFELTLFDSTRKAMGAKLGP